MSVAIQTVNGDSDPDTGPGLVVDGLIHVPESNVLVGENLESPLAHDYDYSTLTPKPEAPAAPEHIQVYDRNGGAVISWDAPDDGGGPITGYTVTHDQGAGTCTTVGATSCAITGLTNARPHMFTVVATNAAGDSGPADADSTHVPNVAHPTVTAPAAPTGVQVTAFADAVEVAWNPPADDGNAPITAYRATIEPSGAFCEVDATATATAPVATSCVIAGLSDTGTYDRVVVAATNAAGSSVPAEVVAPALGGDGYVPPPADPAPPAGREAEPVIDLDLSSGVPTTVEIDGYIATPQGRFVVTTAGRHESSSLDLVGGVLAATVESDLDFDAPANDGHVDIGYQNAVVQRRIRLITSAPGNVESDAVVQVNQNGAYAVNTWSVS